MDKKAIKKIVYCISPHPFCTKSEYKSLIPRAENVFKVMENLGYRKVSGEPPLLTSDSEPQCRILLKKILPEWDIMSIWQQGRFRDIAQAQRESDMEYYGGKE